MKFDRPVRQFWLSQIVVVFGLLGALEPAHSECLSPSAASGTTATTVFRCADQPETARQEQPAVNTEKKQPAVNTEKTTVVQRGPADVPWFDPKTPENSTEPVKAPRGQAAKVEEKIEEKPEEKPSATQNTVKESIEETPKKKLSATKNTIRKKVVKLKPARTKTTKALKTRTKPELKTKAKPEKKISTAKTKVAPEKPDDNTVVWTRKDMPIGNRIVNWLGL